MGVIDCLLGRFRGLPHQLLGTFFGLFAANKGD
jgi:hypothetical protein